MKPSEIQEALVTILPSQTPVFVWGSPGVGKSSVTDQARSKLEKILDHKLAFEDVRGVTLDPVDIRGLPDIENERAVFRPFNFLPHEGAGILFLDELPQAPPLVQSSLLQLVLDRRIGDYVLPDGWMVVAAGNRQTDRSGSHRMITPLLNRFIHLDFEVSVQDWQLWAIRMGIDTMVRSFINWRAELLFDMKFSESDSPSFATPRTWEYVSRIMKVTPPNLRYQLIKGSVGKGPATEFMAFLEIYGRLPDPQRIIANPNNGEPPSDPAVNFALIGALTDLAIDCQTQALRNIVIYAGRMDEEFAAVLIRDVCRVNPNILDHEKVPELTTWLDHHKEMILGGEE